MPLVLVLDSSSLHQINPTGSPAKRLAELVRLGVLELVVHTIVEHEVGTGIVTEAIEARRAAAKQLRFARWLPSAQQQALEEALRKVEEILQTSETMIPAGVKRFLDELGVQRVGFEPGDSEHVFRAYFQGDPPFGTRKSRGDIPDAFILQPISRLVERHGQVHVLVGDKRLKKACQGLGATTHESLRTIFDLPELAPNVVSLALMFEFAREHPDDIKELLGDSIGNEIQWESVQGAFASDNGEATITDYGTISHVDFDFAHAEALADDKVMVPLTCRLDEALVDLYIFKSDFWSMDDRKRQRYTVTNGDWNDHYLEAQAYATLNVKATIVVSLAKGEDGAYNAVEQVEALEVREVTVEDEFMS